MPSRTVGRIVVLAGGLLVAACQDMDPYTRAGTWQPTGANAGNIAAQVANPYDLIRGRGVDRVDSPASSQAIGRIWTDKPKPLPDIGSQGMSGSSSGGGGQGAGGS